MSWPVDPSRYAIFLGLLVVLCATPGPANLFAIATGAHRGGRAVLAGVAGMNAATLVWFAASALGLSAMIVSFPWLFGWIAFAGAAYLAWLALGALWSAATGPDQSEAAKTRTRQSRPPFLDGFAVQIANPKAVLFFSALLPPFIDASRPLLPQLVAFAVAVVAMDAAFMSAYGLGGATISSRMQSPRFRRGFSGLSGLLLLTAAAMVAIR